MSIGTKLTFEFGDNFPGKNFEFYSGLDQAGVVLYHFFMPLENKVFLNEITNIVEPGRPNIATGTFKAVCQILHLLEFSLLVGLNNILHGGVEGHGLQISKHHVENLGLTSQPRDSEVNVNWGRGV